LRGAYWMPMPIPVPFALSIIRTCLTSPLLGHDTINLCFTLWRAQAFPPAHCYEIIWNGATVRPNHQPDPLEHWQTRS